MIVYDQYLYKKKPDLDSDVVIFHAGFSSTESNYSHGKDTRDYYLLHYCTGGKGTYQAGGRTYHLGVNDGFLITPGSTIVHTADKKEPWDLCWIAFFGKEIPDLLTAAGMNEEHLIFHYEKDNFLEECIRSIYDEIRSTRNIAKIKGCFYQFMGKLIEVRRKPFVAEPQQEEYGHFESAMNYIRRHIHTPITVNELANDLRLDPSQVYRIFKSKTGKSPLQVIQDMRMDMACEYLRMTDLPVKDISDMMHFEYQSHFTKQFKKHTGMSPSQYREANQSDDTYVQNDADLNDVNQSVPDQSSTSRFVP